MCERCLIFSEVDANPSRELRYDGRFLCRLRCDIRWERREVACSLWCVGEFKLSLGGLV